LPGSLGGDERDHTESPVHVVPQFDLFKDLEEPGKLRSCGDWDDNGSLAAKHSREAPGQVDALT